MKSYMFKQDRKVRKAIEKQEIWRQKQIDIFYRTGKPIFNITRETQHIRTANSPSHFKEKPRWEI
jgi:hypothetical protein